MWSFVFKCFQIVTALFKELAHGLEVFFNFYLGVSLNMWRFDDQKKKLYVSRSFVFTNPQVRCRRGRGSVGRQEKGVGSRSIMEFVR